MHLELPSHASTSGPSNNTASFAADFGADFGMPAPPHGGKTASSSAGGFGALGLAAEAFGNAFDDFPAAPTSTPPKAALTTQMASSGGGDGGEEDDGDFGDFAEFSGSPKPTAAPLSAAPTAPAELLGWLLQQERFGEAAQLQAHTAATEKLESARAAYRDAS